MEKNKNYPWKGCGTDKEITGCRFSLAVMSDDYADMILQALKHVDKSKVWSHTDALSTIYRGKRVHVVDTVKSCFVNVNDGKTHITMEATFSKGCPGDVDEDSLLVNTGEPIHNVKKNFPVLSKISFYPLGITDYMDHIAYIVNAAIDKGLYKGSSHYATELSGDVHEIFNYFQEMMEYAEKHIDHFVLQVTLSVNSPSQAV